MSKLEKVRLKYNKLRETWWSEPGLVRVADEILDDLDQLTSSHREEIEEAYQAGETDTWYELQSGPGDPDRQHKNPSDYYEKTYKK